MSIALVDIETNGLNPDKIHVAVCKIVDQPTFHVCRTVEEFDEFVASYNPKLWVGHNALNFDIPVLNKLWKANINEQRVVDTAVVSRLVNYSTFSTHSLDELGQAYGCKKSEYTGGWDVWSQEMEDYCIQDVAVLETVWSKQKKYIYDPDWKKAMRVEHDMAVICREMSENGFTFDIDKAETMLHSVKVEMTELEEGFQRDFPPVLKEVKRLKSVRKKSGDLTSHAENALLTYPSTYIDDEGQLVCMDWEAFNPGSAKQRIDKLWDAGWKPVNKTKGHKEWERTSKGTAGRWTKRT